MIDLDDMEAKARAATPGPWEAQPYLWDRGGSGPECYILADGNLANDVDPEDAAHIAACNPAAILALIVEHRALLARVEEVEAALEPFAREEGTWAASVSGKYHPGILEPNQRVAHAKAEFSIGDLRAAARVFADRSGEKGDA